MGRKGVPAYWVVVSDARGKRDGKFVEKIGRSFKKDFSIDIQKYSKWINNGAQPTERIQREMLRRNIDPIIICKKLRRFYKR